MVTSKQQKVMRLSSAVFVELHENCSSVFWCNSINVLGPLIVVFNKPVWERKLQYRHTLCTEVALPLVITLDIPNYHCIYIGNKPKNILIIIYNEITSVLLS